MSPTHQAKHRRLWGHRLFFPAALIYGAAAAPYWIGVYLGAVPGAWTPAIHAHEMLFGFALAVVGGFLLTRPHPGAALLAVGTWVLGRIAMLAGWSPVLAAPLTLAYPAVLFVLAGLPFLRTAKSGHNGVFGPVIGGFAVAEAWFWLADDGGRAAVLSALHLVGLLLFAMGGRIVAAATAGEVRRTGGRPAADRLQPRLEWIGIAGAVVAMASLAADGAPVIWAAGAAATGGATVIRLVRWWHPVVRRRPALWSLHLGYGWVGAGWLAAGVERVAPTPDGAGWHVLGIGALATLAALMMVRASQQREGLPTIPPAAALAALVLLGAATLVRVSAPADALPVATALWTAALLLILEVVRRMVWGRPLSPGAPDARHHPDRPPHP